MEGSADADQRHRIIITMMNLGEKTDTRMIVSWCATGNDVEAGKARRVHVEMRRTRAFPD